MASRQEGRGLGVAGMPAVLLPRGSLLEVLRVGSKGVSALAASGLVPTVSSQLARRPPWTAQGGGGMA